MKEPLLHIHAFKDGSYPVKVVGLHSAQFLDVEKPNGERSLLYVSKSLKVKFVSHLRAARLDLSMDNIIGLILHPKKNDFGIITWEISDAPIPRFLLKDEN